MSFTQSDYTCTVAGLDWPDVDVDELGPTSRHISPPPPRNIVEPQARADDRDRTVREISPPPPAITADEDAASMPPRPRISHLRKLHLARKLDQGCAPRGLKAIDSSARLFELANADAELDGLGDCHMRRFLAYLRQRKTRDGEPLANNTIISHFANIGKMLSYGGPEDRRGTKGNRTACRCGLYGFDQYGRPNPVPCLFADDLPPPDKSDKPTPKIRDVAHWIATVAPLAWGPLQRNVPLSVPKGLWLACLLIFTRNTGVRLESLIKAEWTMLDGHWLKLPKWAVKGKQQPLKVYVNRWALAAAQRVRTDEARIFSWRSSESYLDNLVQEVFPDDPMFRLHRLRSLLINDLIEAGHEIVAQCQVGHKGGVTKENYAKFERLAPKVLGNGKILRQPVLPENISIWPDKESESGKQLKLKLT